jgi:hypothetical protein
MRRIHFWLQYGALVGQVLLIIFMSVVFGGKGYKLYACSGKTKCAGQGLQETYDE